MITLNKVNNEVLLDGGATHHVFYSREVPDGAEDKDIDLAHGKQQGYVNRCDVTFVEPEQAKTAGGVPHILSLRRFIKGRCFVRLV